MSTSRRALVTLLMIAVLASAAEAARSRPPQPGSFDPVEYAVYDSIGTASIAGFGQTIPPHSFLQTIAGRGVELAPVTSYTQRWWDVWVHDSGPLARSDPRANRYVRLVTADSTGHFRFDHLPAGEYFVRTAVLCNPNGLNGLQSSITRVLMGKRVHVGAGEDVSVVLDSLAVQQRVPAKMRDANWIPNLPRRGGGD